MKRKNDLENVAIEVFAWVIAFVSLWITVKLWN